ncbi:MAG: hypothetical protein H6597_05220 [Flavobacteriales bacterium]|nr:hypothetical protein [Flavobacteriales bacterium]MCB9193915.1 hypothetical protein [Flavobacteriales bacterium]
MSRHLLIALVFQCVAQFVPAQPERFYVKLYGIVTDHWTGDPMKGVLVRVLKDSLPLDQDVTGRSGRYEFYLDRGSVYTVWYSKADMVTKHIRIDATEVPIFPDVPFYEMDVQVTLFKWIEGIDYSLFDQPLGLASYKHSVRTLSWDVAYTERMRPLLADKMEEYEKLVKHYRPKRTLVPDQL